MHRFEVTRQKAKQAIQPISLGLIGNPNCGKSSVFNQLTGLRQKVGNFPGVTVDKKLGKLRIDDSLDVSIIDFPGTYSLYPNSLDERIVVQTLVNPMDKNFPDAVIYIADVTRLEKHLLLFTQLRDLGIPLILALNMADVAHKEGLVVNTAFLSKQLKVPVVAISGRSGEGIKELKGLILDLGKTLGSFVPPPSFYAFSQIEKEVASEIQKAQELKNDYRAVLLAHHFEWLPFLNTEQREIIKNATRKSKFEDLRFQVEETMKRYDNFTPIVRRTLREPFTKSESLTEKLDILFTHRLFGPVFFMLFMLLVFQAIFAWASFPMELIEASFGTISAGVRAVLPEGWFTNLLTDGILAGLGGIMIFVPQIAILFFLISLLEEIGYMARAAYIFDRLMQAFGLNGRSIVALISGGACAIPAIMSTRTIANWKERLITILVTPLISCSARIPVYTVLIGFVVPTATIWGVFNLRGLAFMGLYVLGISAALLSALAFKLLLKSKESSFLMLELPEYRLPVMRNVFLLVWEKVKTFVLEAGKVILVISVVLWALASYGPPKKMEAAKQEALEIARQQNFDQTATSNLIAAKQIEASFAGRLGKFIEPAIKPLGFDWKMGIALITSFAAREVFVGTMATIYSIGSENDEYSIRDRMAQERHPISGAPVYNFATALSLLIFYVFAMQCMGTLAVVKRETNSWKWPIIQFTYMSGLAYFGSLLVYQLFA